MIGVLLDKDLRGDPFEDVKHLTGNVAFILVINDPLHDVVILQKSRLRRHWWCRDDGGEEIHLWA